MARIIKMLLGPMIMIMGCASSQEFVRPGTDFGSYKRIAVFPFSDHYTAPGSGLQVADILSMCLLGSNFVVLDRSQTQSILSEQGLGLTGAVNEETAPDVGRILGIQGILTGSINEWGTSVHNIQVVQGADPAYINISAAGLTLKLIDCETGQIVWAGSARGTDMGIHTEARAAKRAIDNILKKLNRHLDFD